MTLDEAIKHAEEVAILNENTCKAKPDSNLKKYKKCAEEHRQLAEWLKELKQLREQPRWIPVSERLPNPGEYNGDVDRHYLVQNEYDDMLVARYTKKECWEQIFQIGEIKEKIVAWQPLPKPYKAESEKKE